MGPRHVNVALMGGAMGRLIQTATASGHVGTLIIEPASQTNWTAPPMPDIVELTVQYPPEDKLEALSLRQRKGFKERAFPNQPFYAKFDKKRKRR